MKEGRGGMTADASDDEAVPGVIDRIPKTEVDVATMRRRGREFALRRFARGAVYGALLQQHLS